MKPNVLVSALGAIGIVSLLTAGCAKSDEAPSQGSSDKPAPTASMEGEGAPAATAARFVEVNEILKHNCLGCHSGPAPKEGFSVVSYESVMKGYEHGPVIVPGDPASSKLVQVVRDTGPKRMPFKMQPLSEEDIQKIESWIQAGAKND